MGSYPFSFLGQFILHKGENDNLRCRQRMFSSHGRKDESCFYLISFFKLKIIILYGVSNNYLITKGIL